MVLDRMESHADVDLRCPQFMIPKDPMRLSTNPQDLIASFDDVRRAIASWPLFERVGDPIDARIDLGLTLVSDVDLRASAYSATDARIRNLDRRVAVHLQNSISDELRPVFEAARLELWRSPEVRRLFKAAASRRLWSGGDLPSNVMDWAIIRSLCVPSDAYRERIERRMRTYAVGRAPGRVLSDGTTEALGDVGPSRSPGTGRVAPGPLAEIDRALEMGAPRLDGRRWPEEALLRLQTKLESRGYDGSLIAVLGRHALAGSSWTLSLPGRETDDDDAPPEFEWLDADGVLFECGATPGEYVIEDGWIPLLVEYGAGDPVFVDVTREVPVLVQIGHDSAEPISDPLPLIDAIRMARARVE